MKFKLKKMIGHARLGVLETSRGSIHTPIFAPVGTQATVKSLTPQDLEDCGAQMILANTYHLYLRPGEKLIQDFNGLHQFMKWRRPILTDSGGFQVSSLGLFREKSNTHVTIKPSKITEEGVSFWSHIDGSQHLFTPEKSIQIQRALGADLIVAFDEAAPDKDKTYTKESMHRTHRWLDRSITQWKSLEKENQVSLNSSQALFGVVQGGLFKDLREQSMRYVLESQTPGIAIGGGMIGVDWRTTEEQIGWIRHLFPKDRPIHFLGVGSSPEEAIAAVLSGADSFDCVAPTRLARAGIIYSGQVQKQKIKNTNRYSYEVDFPFEPGLTFVSEFEKGKYALSNAQFARDKQVLSHNCGCYTCTEGFSRAYLRHLLKAGELLYYRLATIHNIHTMITIVEETKKHLLES